MSSSSKINIRSAEHAGSWYPSNPSQLNTQLDSFFEKVKCRNNKKQKQPRSGGNDSSDDDDCSSTGENGSREQQVGKIRAIIGPHAGYRYCGQTSAYAYYDVQAKRDQYSEIKTVFVIGPSHHLYMNNQCGLSQATAVDTPIGQLKVNRKLIDELYAKYGSNGNALFTMTKDMEDEEEEHSLELHFPFIAKVFDAKKIDIVPIIVGHLQSETATRLGQILSPYLDDPSCFFVISSDFCHWGTRFNYTYYDESKGEIWESIKSLDLLGAAYICNKNTTGFEDYLKKFKNTICGRHAILMLMNAMSQSSKADQFEVNLCHYSQSSHAMKSNDSSVSYASFTIVQK